MFISKRNNYGNNTVYRNTVTCVSRVTSNRVEVHRLNSQHLAMVRTSNMAELVPSGFSVYNHVFFCSGPNTFPRRNNPFMSIQLRSIINCLSIFPILQFSRRCAVVSPFPFHSGGLAARRFDPQGA